MASILGGPRGSSGALAGAPAPPSGNPRRYRFGFVVLIWMYQQTSVPAGCVLSSSSTSRDQVALVAFLSPRPLSRPRLSIGPKNPANGACSPAVSIRVGVLLSNVVKVPTQLAGPAP